MQERLIVTYALNYPKAIQRAEYPYVSYRIVNPGEREIILPDNNRLKSKQTMVGLFHEDDKIELNMMAKLGLIWLWEEKGRRIW